MNRMEVVTNGRKLSQEIMDGVKANGQILLPYEYVKPGQETPVRKIGYAVAVPGFDMYIGTGAYLDDLDAKLRPIAWVLALAILGIAVVSGGIAWFIGRSISRPLALLGARMQDIADGKLDGEIPGVGRGDEVGKMAATVQIFKDNAVRMRELEKSEAETQARAASDRRAAMENLAGDFERSVNGIVRTVSSAAAGMQTTAQSMTSTASDASARAANVSAASQNASSNVGTVAAAAEELSSSVTEISRQVARSSEIASKAVGDAERTNATVQVLSTGAEKIGEVVKLIHSIAAQTNLLALNATIEAARAGDAGRGFAVVAQEVKSLASQTARATDDITAKITAIQQATKQTVEANGSIQGTVEEVQTSADRIREAMELQAQTVTMITAAVDETALAADSMSSTIAAIRSDTENVAKDIDQVEQGFGRFSEQIANFKASAKEFVSGIAA
jgi:methyl-accepting chemotaxis protein